jgi:phage major head subunit gpT-like protein
MPAPRNLSSRAIRGLVRESLINDTPPAWVEATSSLFTSDQESETYKWLSDVPTLREWKGGRNIKRLVDYGITVVNQPYETGLEFDVKDMRLEKLGQIQLRIGEMARRARTHWSLLLTNLLIGNGLAYDGVAFFSASHAEEDSGTQSNLYTNSGTTVATPSASDMQSGILRSVERLLSFKDGAGEPVAEDSMAFHVMVPTNMMTGAAAALGNSVIVQSGSAVDNTILSLGGFSFSMSVNPRLSANDVFYVFNTDTSIPTLIRQTELEPQISSKAEGSDHEFDTDSHQYGIKCDRAVAFGRWQNAVQVTNTA